MPPLQTKRLMVINTQSGSYPDGGIKPLFEALPQAITLPNPDELEVEYYDLAEQGFDIQVLKQAIEASGAGIVIAAGGDGTVRLVVGAIQDMPDVKMGILPLGTGNLLAKALNIPNDPVQALQVILTEATIPLPMAIINNKLPFTLVAGTGLAADIMHQTDSQAKKTFGQWAYYWTALRQLVQPQWKLSRIRLDHQTLVMRTLGVLVVVRNDFFKTFLPVDPIETPEDEYLHIFIFKAKSQLDYVGFVQQLLSRSFNTPGGGILYYRSKTIQLTSWPKNHLQVDGDTAGYTPFTARYVPNSCIQVIAPKPVEATHDEGLEVQTPVAMVSDWAEQVLQWAGIAPKASA